MTQFKEMMEKLKHNDVNTLEYYDNSQKFSRKFSSIYVDVLKAIEFLKINNLKKGDKVGIIAENSYEFILVDLACIGLGCISVPFHSSNIKDKQEDILDEYNLSLLFVDNNHQEYLDLGSKVKDMKSFRKTLDDLECAEEKFNTQEGDEVLSIVFTSGTTSFPKSIEITVEPMEDFIPNGIEMYGFNSEDKIIIFLPLSHYGQRMYVYGAILVGFNIVMCMPQNVVGVLRNDKPTILVAVPYFFENIYNIFYNKIMSKFSSKFVYNSFVKLRRIIPQSLEHKIQRKFFKPIIDFWGGKMRLLVTGSAPIAKNILEFYDNVGVRLYEGYGTNETGLIALNYPAKYKIGSVGTIFPKKEVVLDDEGQVLVRSKYCWAKRYLNLSDEENLEVFGADGFIKTGDIGYFDEDGFLHINGRIKEMLVLSSGKKVHPNIIEDEINKMMQVKQSVVFGDNHESLSAVIVKSNEYITEKDIKAGLKSINAKLPVYAHVNSFILINESFTVENGLLTNNLKLNRKNIYKKYRKEIENLYD